MAPRPLSFQPSLQPVPLGSPSSSSSFAPGGGGGGGGGGQQRSGGYSRVAVSDMDDEGGGGDPGSSSSTGASHHLIRRQQEALLREQVRARSGFSGAVTVVVAVVSVSVGLFPLQSVRKIILRFLLPSSPGSPAGQHVRQRWRCPRHLPRHWR